jgi:hypothetical protein
VQQLVELLPRQLETEGVLGRARDGAHRPAGQQRADGETFTGNQFPDLAIHLPGFGADTTLFDYEETVGEAGVRAQDHLALGIEAEGEVHGHLLQVRRRHLVERGVAAPEMDGGSE